MNMAMCLHIISVFRLSSRRQEDIVDFLASVDLRGKSGLRPVFNILIRLAHNQHRPMLHADCENRGRLEDCCLAGTCASPHYDLFVLEINRGANDVVQMRRLSSWKSSCARRKRDFEVRLEPTYRITGKWRLAAAQKSVNQRVHLCANSGNGIQYVTSQTIGLPGQANAVIEYHLLLFLSEISQSSFHNHLFHVLRHPILN